MVRWRRLMIPVVINGTADSTAPTLTSATVDGTAVKLNFSEALQTTQADEWIVYGSVFNRWWNNLDDSGAQREW